MYRLLKHNMCLLITAILLISSTNVYAWWNEDWPYRLPISLDTSATSGAAIAEAHTDATVLVKLHTANFEDFFLVKEDLSDLRFMAADDATPLKFHVEYFDVISQLAYIWVKVPELTQNNATGKIWMYYGNQESSASSADAGGSFDGNTAAVFHFSDVGTLPKDSSAYAVETASFTGTVDDNSIFAKGARFSNGSSLLIADNPYTAISEEGSTVSFWFNADGGSQILSYLFQRSDTANTLSIIQQGSSLSVELNGSKTIGPINKVVPGTWQHISLVLSAESMRLYLDGNELASVAIELPIFSGAIALGADVQAGNGFNGVIDELRIDNIARSADWVKALYASQGQGGKLMKFQPGEQYGSGGSSDTANFFSVIIGNTDLTGTIVIILLGLMALMSWIVMVGKFLYISRVGKDNDNFMHQYQMIGDQDPGMLNHSETEVDKALDSSPIVEALFGDHDHFQSSPLYRLYHRGIEEVHSRLSSKSAGARKTETLSQGALSAIKASIDSQMVREHQRLNKYMVLLTIAVSGGPFLGLFGTVLGVMIVFASIAASGDVSIAAIAPGVAAALLTTIVGLVVAIPAMFAYNWLQTRVRDNVAEMRVFTQTFMTRIAEYYGDL